MTGSTDGTRPGVVIWTVQSCPAAQGLGGWAFAAHSDSRGARPSHGDLRKAGVTMTGYHARWARPEETADDPERIAIREALAFGKALYDSGVAVA